MKRMANSKRRYSAGETHIILTPATWRACELGNYFYTCLPSLGQQNQQAINFVWRLALFFIVIFSGETEISTAIQS